MHQIPGNSTGSLLGSPAFPHVLQRLCQQEGNRGLQYVARLLCTCKAMRMLVTEHCSGLLSVSIMPVHVQKSERLRSVAAWLYEHSQLLGELQLYLSEPEQEAEVALALTGAASNGNGTLQLRRLVHSKAGSRVASLLNVLSSNCLTSLCLKAAPQPGNGLGPKLLMTDVIIALLRLQGLQSLELKMDFMRMDLIQAVGRLQHLTNVELDSCPAQHLKFLPTQLMQCRVVLSGQEAQPVRIGHLIALQRLTLDGQIAAAGSQFPPNLLELCLWDVSHLQDLLPLQHLHSLEIHCCTMSAPNIAWLARLRSLARLVLRYSTMAAAAAAAAVWPLLRLRELELVRERSFVEPEDLNAPANVLLTSFCTKVTGLTALSLLAEERPFSTTPEQFATSLRPLTNLRKLVLSSDPIANGCVFDLGWQFAEEVGYLAPVIRTIADLPSLTDLTIKSAMQDPDVRALAAVGSQLTRLEIASDQLGDFEMCVLANRLTNLRHLEADCTACRITHMPSHMTDASAVLISQHLAQLTCLKVKACSISDRGAELFSSLRHLSVLWMLKTHVTRGTMRQLREASSSHLEAVMELVE